MLLLVFVFAKLASAPVADLRPATELTVAFRLDCRLDFRSPFATAEARSTTWITTRSFTARARTSRARSAVGAAGFHNEPELAGFAPAGPRIASSM